MTSKEIVEIARKLQDQIFTAQQLLRIFGYSPSTIVTDTQAFRLGFLQPIPGSRPQKYRVVLNQTGALDEIWLE